jgi:hypothetical protein
LVTATIVGSNNLIYGGTRYKTLSARMHPDFSRHNRTGMPVNDIGIPKRRRHEFKDYKTPCKILGKGRIGFLENYVGTVDGQIKLGQK